MRSCVEPTKDSFSRDENLRTLRLPTESTPSAETLRKQYRKEALSALHSPGGGDAVSLRRIQMAYDALRDDPSYAGYDDSFFFEEAFFGEELFDQLVHSSSSAAHAPCPSGCPTCHSSRRARGLKIEKKKVPRNAVCPCGSGNKYKKCCLKKDELAEKLANQRQTARSSKLSAAQRKKLLKAADESLQASAAAAVPPHSHRDVSDAPVVEILDEDEIDGDSTQEDGGGGGGGGEDVGASVSDEEPEEAFVFDGPDRVVDLESVPARAPARQRTRPAKANVSPAAVAAAAAAAAAESKKKKKEEAASPADRKMFRGQRSMNSRNSDDWLLFQNKGDELMAKGAVQDAVTFYSQAILSHPERAAPVLVGNLYLSRAKAFQTLGLASKSRFDCIKAAEYLGAEEEVKDFKPKREAEERPLSLDSVAKLQIRLQPLLANVVSLREWVHEDGDGVFAKELAPLISQLESAELLANSALASLQKQLVETGLSEDADLAPKK